MSHSMQKDDEEKCAVSHTREPGEEEEDVDKRKVVIVENLPTNEVVVVADDDAEDVGSSIGDRATRTDADLCTLKKTRTDADLCTLKTRTDAD